MTDFLPLDAWAAALIGHPPALELPTSRGRQAQQPYRRSEHTFCIDGELASSLRDLSNSASKALIEVLFAAFLVQLHRTGGQRDLVLGASLGEPTGGQLLPLRGDLSGEPGFLELLERTSALLAQGRERGELDLPGLLERLDLADSTALFSVVVRAADQELPEGCRAMDLVLRLQAQDAGPIDGAFEANAELFDDDALARMVGHWGTLLAGLAAAPEAPISSLPFLTAAEREQILVTWNDKTHDFPEDATLHGLFAEQAAREPDAVAAVFRGETLTYAQLDARANQVAHHLRGLGVGPDVVVGISVERSLEMVIGLMGIAKAGGAYLPMDPAYPRERVQYMIDDSRVGVLCTQRHLADELPESDATIVLLDEHALFEGQPTSTPDSGADALSLSYVIYTSGSTGAPKGVMLNHQGRVNNFLDFNRRYDIGAGDGIIALASLSFDMCAYDVFGTLAAGAKIVLPDPEGMQDPVHWATLMNEQRVTTWHTAPAMLKMLVDYLEQERGSTPQALRLVLLGGDWIPVNLPDRLRALRGAAPGDPGLRIISMGGATECSMDSTIFEILEVDPAWKSIPYGEPMTNQLAYVLDANFAPVPIGVPGELYLGGIGVGRGYFERPELTAERFLDNPFRGSSKSPLLERMYRTGDLARWMPDGNLELLGRMDNQVKIRGYRIELGEIESRLREHPAVKEGVVITRDDGMGEKRLVAYIVQDAEWRGPEAEQSDLGSEQVEQWETVYDHAYSGRAEAEIDDPTFNIVSWDSSYTNEPLPEEQMRVWVEQTVDRIRRHGPGEVLEIGCGMGLLLFRIAPDCTRYVGTDFSKVALDYVARHKDALGLGQVELARRWADDFEGVTEDSLDAIVLNSIILDFPSMDYLMQVLTGAAKAVRPGGTIFVGDVRGLPLMEAYQSSVQLFQAPDELPVDQLRARINRLIRHEEELVIDPTFFAWLATQLPQVGRVQIQQKRGGFVNELNAFRYDVTIHIGDRAEVPAAEARWLDWEADGLDAAGLRALLTDETPDLLCVRNVPNARTRRDVRLVELLHAADGPATAGALRAALDAEFAEDPGQNPEDLWALADELGYEADVRFSADLATGRVDVAFLRRGTDPTPALLFPDETGLAVDAGRRADSFANNPMLGKLARRMGPDIRQVLATQLPEYMVPALYVPLDAMPLSPNGKVDRKRLPEPDTSRPELEADYKAAGSPVEEVVADVWTEVLGFDRVGIDDTFLELGGHSLLAVLIQTRLNQIFPFGLTLGEIFEYPTIAQLSRRIEARGAEHGIDAVEVCQILQSIEGLSDEEVANRIDSMTD